MDAPAWLAEEPEIQALLATVLDRFDRQAGTARERAILLPIEKHLAALEHNDARADQLWELVRDLEACGIASIDAGKRGAYDSPWVGAKLRFAPACEERLRDWLQRPATPSAWEQWRAVVAQHATAFADAGQALSARRIAIEGRSAAEVVAAFAKLRELRMPATLRQLSAFAFWGDSKVLDDRAELLQACFPELPIRERPIVVAVHLPMRIDGVLFIENQDTYTSAISGYPAALGRLALVYMAGFRTAAVRIRARDGACLHFSGRDMTQAQAFERWWFDETAHEWPLNFWGDLDYAGMQILKALRARFGHVAAWQPGYAPMLEELRTLGAHSSGQDATRQIDPRETGCVFADTVLLPAIRAHGFRDQERIARSAAAL